MYLRTQIHALYSTLKVLTDAKAACMLACKDDFAFGNLPCTARRAFSPDCSLQGIGLREHVSAKQSVTFIICGARESAGMVVYLHIRLSAGFGITLTFGNR